MLSHIKLMLIQVYVNITLDSNLNQFINENVQLFCLAVEDVVHFVNQHGGWNVIRWAHHGTVVDTSDYKESTTI